MIEQQSTESSAGRAAIDRLLVVARWLLASGALAAGLWSLDHESVPWAALSSALFLVPLATLAAPVPWLKAAGAWLAVFLIGQTVLSATLNSRAVITLPPNLRVEVDVRGGLEGIRGVQVVTTDARGFRVTPPIDYRNKRAPRIVAIGGSTTEQIYVDDTKTWSHLLQLNLSRQWNRTVEVVNTGVSGLRAVHHLHTLRSVADMRPDLALILLGINDWNHDVVAAMEKRGFRRTVLDPESEHRWRFFRNSLLGRALTFWRRPPAGVVPVSRVEQGDYYAPWRNSLARRPAVSYQPTSVSPTYARDLVRLALECHRLNIKCMFVTQPTAYQPTAPEALKASFWMTPPNQDYTLDFDSMVAVATVYNQHLRQVAAAQQLYLCDAAPQLAASFDNFYDDCHLNIGGSLRMAEVVTACVRAAGLPSTASR